MRRDRKSLMRFDSVWLTSSLRILRSLTLIGGIVLILTANRRVLCSPPAPKGLACESGIEIVEIALRSSPPDLRDV
jgi:hypothetical protein